MRQQSMQYNAGAFFYFQRQHIIYADGRAVQFLHAGATCIIAVKPFAQRRKMTTGFGPQAAVFFAGIFQCKPKTNAGRDSCPVLV